MRLTHLLMHLVAGAFISLTVVVPTASLLDCNGGMDLDTVFVIQTKYAPLAGAWSCGSVMKRKGQEAFCWLSVL